jgi:rubrerythrin
VWSGRDYIRRDIGMEKEDFVMIIETVVYECVCSLCGYTFYRRSKCPDGACPKCNKKEDRC